ncbi:MAG: recombinase RecA [Candidatus Dadabacteria bacterium]|nr:recombinase RecA [Candidatus Dadabacteria bacterium]MYA48192.1 recombinase RecA [Candidatus Dadabacteria bacterium]MYF48410.1 recombinase RecA [Candidatus Dadabacteria bacterium]MYG82890.1 recombinase RecA [Candidatus Dadabacteria bacterium]MYK49547.1 recombinase RecA [Candidatus Dadabacteria bacterium]
MSDTDDKNKSINVAIDTIEKQFGKGSIMRLGEDASLSDIPVITSGSLGLDIALGVGGFPRGRIIEVFGPEASGKTTIALHAIAEAQKAGGITAFVDAEHSLSTSYAAALGIKVEDLLISQPDFGEQALEIVDTLIRSNAVDLIVLDSVAALTPRAEIEGEMGDTHVGLQARLMSQALRKITANVSRSKTIVIFVNQLRMKIGVPAYMNPETTTGGNALRFYSSMRVDIRRIGSLKDGDRIVGNRVRAKLVKNKVAPPFREAEFEVVFGRGISKLGELVDLGAKFNVIKKSGTWYSYEGERIGQGRENSKKFLHENPEIREKIRNEIIKASGMGSSGEAEEGEPARK